MLVDGGYLGNWRPNLKGMNIRIVILTSIVQFDMPKSYNPSK